MMNMFIVVRTIMSGHQNATHIQLTRREHSQHSGGNVMTLSSLTTSSNQNNGLTQFSCAHITYILDLLTQALETENRIIDFQETF